MKIKEVYELVRPSLKNHLFKAILTFFTGTCSSLGTIYLSYLTGKIINQIIYTKGNLTSLTPRLSFFICIIVFTVVNLWCTTRMTYFLAYNIIEDLRSQALTTLNKTKLSLLNKLPTGDLISRLTNDTENIANALYQIGNTIFVGITTIIAALIIMLMMSPILACVVFITTPLIFFFMSIVVKRSQPYTKKQQNLVGQMSSFLTEYLPNHRLIHNFNQVNLVNEKYQQLNDELALVGQKSQFISSLTNPLSRFVDHLTYALIGLLGGLLYYYAHKNAMIGVISSFTLYASQFAKPFIELSGLANQLQIAYVGLIRLHELTKFPQIDEKNSRPLANKTSHDLIKFENVSFGYKKDQTIIKDLSFTLSKGQTLAIVGPTGSGKSTLISLLMRFNTPTSGKIKFNGQDIQNISLTDYYAQFSLVLQNTWSYETSIYENLTFGKKISNEQFKRACKEMQLDNIIDKLPKKYDTLLSKANLSNGEKQLLTITRAYLNNPKILILDEATSSLDMLTEQLVKNALDKLMKGRTSIMIAHHLNTINQADQIMVLDKGKIVEMDNHQKLMANKKLYYELYTNQFSEGE